MRGLTHSILPPHFVRPRSAKKEIFFLSFWVDGQGDLESVWASKEEAESEGQRALWPFFVRPDHVDSSVSKVFFVVSKWGKVQDVCFNEEEAKGMVQKEKGRYMKIFDV